MKEELVSMSVLSQHIIGTDFNIELWKILSKNPNPVFKMVKFVPDMILKSENRLYAVGGVNSVGRLSSVECYCVEEDR